MLVHRLNPGQLKLHENAVALAVHHRRLEADIIRVLQAIEQEKIFKLLGCSSLFVYAVSALGLSEAQAYAFITVARKCRDCEALNQAIMAQELSVSKAARIASALTVENAAVLVQFATTHSARETDLEVARLRPRDKRTYDKVKPLSPDRAKLECDISPEVSLKLRRAQSVLSSKLGRAVDFNTTLERALDGFLERHDPVVKAERAHEKQAKQSKNPAPQKEVSQKNASELCTGRVGVRTRKVGPKRRPLSAGQRHAVNKRDQGRCTYVDPRTGERCANDRWLHAHHVIPVSLGGGNELENLRTLCAHHHDLVHQLELPFLKLDPPASCPPRQNRLTR